MLVLMEWLSLRPPRVAAAVCLVLWVVTPAGAELGEDPSSGPPLLDPSTLQKDPRLSARLTVEGTNPKLDEIFPRLQAATGLTITMDSNLKRHDPEFGQVGLRDVPAWVVMQMLSHGDLEGGGWKRTDTGYMLTARASLREKPLSSPWWQNYRIVLLAVVILLLGLAAAFLVVAWRRGLLTPATPRGLVPTDTA